MTSLRALNIIKSAVYAIIVATNFDYLVSAPVIDCNVYFASCYNKMPQTFF